MLIHSIPPTYDEGSRILILGSFPSEASRKQEYFYGHPQNRFWKVLSAVFEDKLPGSIEEKKAFLHKHHIALWDVIASCDIIGSSDSSITNVKVNDLSVVLNVAKIQAIFVNGRKASELYKKYIEPTIGVSASYLPSTSPANAFWSLEKLIAAWDVLKG
ncbi:MAG: DNA-deoxyinosine glycosylase [Peptostreptococcaceae bacterium]|nr:DNA-deoxyinosine glycosylase [Peptostreptococcaceae bacterium]